MFLIRGIASACVLTIAAFMAGACRSSDAEPPLEAPPNLEFTLKNDIGEDVRLADFKGRPLVITFWATWCTSCKRQMPYLNEFSRTMADRGLVVLGITVDDTVDQLREFLTSADVNYEMLLGTDQDDLKREYDVLGGIPVTWLIRPDGTVQSKAVGYRDRAWFERELNRLVA